MDVVTMPIGKEGGLEVDIVDGKIVVSASHKHESGKITMVAEEDLTYFLDKLAAKINNAIVTSIIVVLKGALKSL